MYSPENLSPDVARRILFRAQVNAVVASIAKLSPPLPVPDDFVINAVDSSFENRFSTLTRIMHLDIIPTVAQMDIKTTEELKSIYEHIGSAANAIAMQQAPDAAIFDFAPADMNPAELAA